MSGEVFEKNSVTRYVYIILDSGESKTVASRSITAPAIDFSSDTQDYFFYIWGKSSSGTVSPKKVSFESSSSTTGIIELDFPVMTYSFTLAATESEPSELTSSKILEKAIAVGYTNADLTYSKNVKFTLSSNGLSATGKVYLDFYLDSDIWTSEQVSRLTSDFLVTVALYKSNGEAQTAEFGLENLSTTTPVSTENWFASVPAGEYDMVVTMSEGGGEYLVYTYSDKVIVAPNRTINADVYIPNVMLDLPAAPTDFKAAYCMDYRFYSLYDTDSDTATKLTSNEQIDTYNFNSYGILLSWKDNSNNESGFKVTLADISKISDGTRVPSEIISDVNSAEMTDAIWKQIVEPYEGQTDVVKIFTPSTYETSADYILGSVKKNETSLIVWGNFGSCYIAKIEAMNAAGLSEACYVSLSEDFNVNVYDENYTNNTAVYTGYAFSTEENPCKVINRYKIVYYLCGGKITYTHGPNSVISNETYLVKYHTYGNGTINCYTASDTSAGTINDPALIYFGSDSALYGKRWSRWQYGAVGGTDLINILGGSTVTVNDDYSYQKPDDYTGYTSLYLFARYD